MLIDTWLTLGSLVLIAGGSVGAIIQWQKSNKIKRAEFIMQIISKMREDKDIVEAMNKFAYKSGWYDKDFHDSHIEPLVDKALSLLNYICYLYVEKLIVKKDFEILKSEITIACNSRDVLNYLWNLHHFTNELSSYNYLINYILSENNDDFKNEFQNKNSSKYTKYLRF